jgi:Domain of Unknown Function (DUF349).
MMDTQDTNLPTEERTSAEEIGKLEESQAMEVNPVTESETVINTEETIAEENPEEQSTPEAVEAEKEEEPSEDESSVVENSAEGFPDAEEQITESPEVKAAEELLPEETVPVEEEASAPESPADETSQEEILPSETTLVDEETKGEAAVEPEMIPSLDAVALAAMTKPEIVERLKQVVSEPKRYIRSEADALKQAYYKLRRTETDALKKEFLESGGEEAAFVAPEDEMDAQVKSYIAEYKEKRASVAAEEERQKESNLVIKQHLVERLKVLTESQDDFNKLYNEFREIQRKWREIRLIPQESAKELWRNYQLYNERFYDIVKINNQFRDYDFKKNLEMKTALCETVERLTKEDIDVISAFHQLQKLHQQWREIGPVSKDFRESIWERFKDASTIINKKHQSHFEGLKDLEEKNLEEKKLLCEEIESINYDALKSLKDWEKKTSKVMALQLKWRTIGFATKKHNVKVFERFRTSCDKFFDKKNEFYKSIKQEMDKNLELKRALIEKAESLKDSTDWKETTKAFVELQNEWKKIGVVSRKYSESLWKQFISICDYFFDQKNKEFSSQKTEETENLETKKALIEKIKTIEENLTDEEALSILRGYITEWNSIGFVPIREKDKLYKMYREVCDKQFDKLKVNERDRRVQQYRSNITELAGGGKNKLYNERDKLMRIYERMKGELQTYENNIGFFNVSSKGGDGLMKEMGRKIARLKEEMEVLVKKIEAIDENLD